MKGPPLDPEPSWSWSPGDELAAGLLAWALLGDGRRCETWLAWDLGRWCPVAVKLPRPGRSGRAVAALAQEAQVAASTAHPGIRPCRIWSSSTWRARPSTTPWPTRGPAPDRRAAGRHAAGRRPRAPARPRPGPPGRQAGQRGPTRRPPGADRPRPGPPAGRAAGRRPPARLAPWMAPEQVRRRPASQAMDLFALGAVLYELATGTPAFEVADQGPPERRWPPAGRPATRAQQPQPGGAGGAGPAGGGPTGRRGRGGPALAQLGHPAARRLASVHYGASPARSTTCVAIAGGP